MDATSLARPARRCIARANTRPRDDNTRRLRAPCPAMPRDSDDSPASRRPIRSFVLRAGRMGARPVARAGRARAALRAALPAPRRSTSAALFGRHAPTVLEIGFGMGDAHRGDRRGAAAARLHRHRGACARRRRAAEAHRASTASTNLRLVQHDAVEVLRAHDRARLARRRARLLPRPLAQEAAPQAPPDPGRRSCACWPSRLAPGGYLHCATDWQPYAEQMLEVLSAEPLLRNTRRRAMRRGPTTGR